MRATKMAAKATVVSMFALTLFLGIPGGGDAGAQCVPTPLPAAGIGPVNPANGYPRYYVDASGLALGPCFDLGGLCVLTPADLPNPLAPLSFPGNFPEEWFYSLGPPNWPPRTAGVASPAWRW